jgi:hypothetical protein
MPLVKPQGFRGVFSIASDAQGRCEGGFRRRWLQHGDTERRGHTPGHTPEHGDSERRDGHRKIGMEKVRFLQSRLGNEVRTIIPIPRQDVRWRVQEILSAFLPDKPIYGDVTDCKKEQDNKGQFAWEIVIGRGLFQSSAHTRLTRLTPSWFSPARSAGRPRSNSSFAHELFGPGSRAKP